MNERMLKLYKTAQVPHTAIDPSNNMPYETTCFSPEKFAELIVRECMSCAQFVGITNDRIGLGPMPIRYTSMVNDQIKKHFGLEE